ncbi:hypothetical protein [uncultured Aquimarina sp.]|uniref:hypothetical protein n=1 Tax=uncultured Aquimarina sp. TaxID=575652 RepID=UPI002614C404|nr:hypothetical protein [uncultured Aquimarina sp.]
MSGTMNTTSWFVSTKTVNGVSTSKLEKQIGTSTPMEFKIKGVCYSPCPINGSNGNAPGMGDWFWDTFSGTGYKITGWDVLWASGSPNREDLKRIKALGVNTIRVYSMLSRQVQLKSGYPKNVGGKEVYEYDYPSYPWDSTVHKFTHNNFLDACEEVGLSVLVGVPLPQGMFWKELYDNPAAVSQNQKTFWKEVLKETVESVGTHKAVMGFIVQNELDDNTHLYEDKAKAKFWWSQAEVFSKIAKTAAPNKLVGMAVHDNPLITQNCQTYMAACPSIDFWGVNTYQTQTFRSIFIDNSFSPPAGYNVLTGDAIKPVIFTEYGIPATGHSTPTDPSTIYSDNATETLTANVLTNVLPQAYGVQPTSPLKPYDSGLCLGLYYFEYCDEWWNQGGSPDIYTWYGGAASGFPNGFWDQDGFGIYSVARGGNLENNATIWNQPSPGYGSPNTPVDVHTERTPIATAIKKAFDDVT